MILALLLAAQEAPGTAGQSDPKPEPWPEQSHFEERGYGLEQASTPASLLAVHRFGACIANGSTAKAARTMASDFRSTAYRRGLDQLVDANRECTETRGWSRMQSSRLLLAGAIAEHLVERDPTAVNVQLARAALKPAPVAFSPSDAGAICVVRSVPDDVGKLFATEAGSKQEGELAAPLKGILTRCMAGQPVEINTAGLRAILATAAYRTVQTGAAN